jgi:hypothetical protein
VKLQIDCRLCLGTVLVSGYIVWLRVIRNWRKLHNVKLQKLYLPGDVISIVEESLMDWSCRINLTEQHTGLSEILNHNKQLTPVLRAYEYIYTKLQT